MVAVLLMAMASSTGAFADADSTALAKLNQIPPATNYVPRDEDSPKLPVVIVTARGVSVNHGAFVPFDQVLVVLAALPEKAWIHGRVIIYFPFPPGLSGDGDPPPQKVRLVKAKLDRAGIRLIGGASA
jgi:hypothetical protein